MQHTNRIENKLNDRLTMGIDLGMNVPVAMAINGMDFYRKTVGGDEIEAYRKKFQQRKRTMLKTTDGRGNGRKRAMMHIDQLRDAESRFRDAINHKYSRFVVDEALKNRCATIQVEDLSGISNQDKGEKMNRRLKNWPYFDLYSKIEYKALETGIKVIKIQPAYTSQRCNKCGHIERANRKNQERFICVACAHEDNADLNAARNIATPGIESIIKEHIKKHNKAEVKKWQKQKH